MFKWNFVDIFNLQKQNELIILNPKLYICYIAFIGQYHRVFIQRAREQLARASAESTRVVPPTDIFYRGS